MKRGIHRVSKVVRCYENGVQIRMAVPEDAEELLNIYSPYVRQTAITFEYEVPTIEEFGRRVSHTLEKYPYLVAEWNGKPIGYAYAGPFKTRAAYDWAVETSIYIRQDMRKKGLGGHLYETLEELLGRQGFLNLYACIACPAVEEDPYLDKNSVQFHEHMGYHLAGEFHQCGYKFDRWYNMVWMEKHLGEHHSSQPAVKRINEEPDNDH